jgi:WS/DGAT C-terminal domain/Wax ester synthase-like Acyl-CoA acyltransferase domain
MNAPAFFDGLFNSFSSQPSHWLIGLGVTGATAVWWRNKAQTKKRGCLQRQWSFTSVGMAIGVFPKPVQAPATIINAAIYFRNCPTVEEIAEMVVKPMLAFERLSSIPVPDSSSCRPPKKAFEPSDLVRKVVIQETEMQATNSAIFEHLQDSLTTGRDELPWWEFLVIENKGLGESACVLRIHHALADGISLVHVFEKIIAYEDGTPVQSIVLPSMARKTTSKNSSAKLSFHFVWMMIRDTLKILTLGMSRFDDPTVFTKPNHAHKHSNRRSCVILPVVPLAFVKELKNAATVTVNDIVMTAVSQAIHDLCESQSCPVLLAKQGSLQSRALLPVALPRTAPDLEDPATALKNRWCLVSTDMAVGSCDILHRLERIHNATTLLKHSPQALIQLGLQNNVAGRLPQAVGQQTVLDVFRRHSLVFSNVPGPERTCKLAEHVVTGVQMFFSNLIPQVGVLSYAGYIGGNIVLDPEAVPGADHLAVFYAQALVDLALRLNVTDIPASLKAFATSNKSA